MAIYEVDSLTEQSIYGSSRLGIQVVSLQQGYRSLGGKRYELSNHLGNVLAVVSDNIHQSSDSTWAEVINLTDYYPFGLTMEGRAYQDSLSYRYGFNGKENDSETGTQDYGFRIYDPKIAKFLSVDPLAPEFPWNSTYAFSEGSPVSNVDLDGLEKLDFRTHMSKGMASGNPALGLITYPADWLEDKIVGGSERFIKSGFKYAQNERVYQENLTRPHQHFPEDIGKINHTITQLQTGAEMIQAGSDVLEGYTAVMGLAMGGVESGLGGGLIKSTVPRSIGGGAAKKISPLRAAYVSEVEGLKSQAHNLKAAGNSSEQIAKTLHSLRRDIGVRYKSLTPEDLLQQIYQRNQKKYGDKLGPSIDYLRQQGKSWDDIIDSATRPGGKDLGL
ncbi:RHS repeat domain-containing protein [Litoribacter populi]|uniref:RHS repeat domain-containing protein n=1 Tax=Litoribacter populi TaxID=2598460 RepID=UPI00117F59DA|nr:RHS repeat-associated core domain-containing protein [Litoribacter populi]